MEIKLKLLHENREKVLRKQLLLLNNSVCAYYAGDLELMRVRFRSRPAMQSGLHVGRNLRYVYD